MLFPDSEASLLKAWIVKRIEYTFVATLSGLLRPSPAFSGSLLAPSLISLPPCLVVRLTDVLVLLQV